MANSITTVVAGGLYVDSSSDHTHHVGWVTGAGFESMVTGRASVRVEYLYSDFGTDAAEVTLFGQPHNLDADLSLGVARVAVILRF